jgi:mRNA interferase RelE/StbE
VYRVELTTRARKSLIDIASPDRERIIRRLTALAHDPFPHGSRKVAGSDLFRIRSGDYRIIYQVKKSILLVLVIRIGHRREIYR